MPITTIDSLQKYLHAAMRLEHATLPPYLTALYSIHPGANPDATHVLRVVAIEEMLHLTLAANLLNAVRGKPDLTAPDFVPIYPAYLPDGEEDFQVHLQAFSEDALGTFMKIERPKMAPDPQSPLRERKHRHGLTSLAPCPTDPNLHYYSIGEFYRAIDEGLETLEKEAAASGTTIFVGDPKLQVTSEFYYSGGGKLHPVTDLASARRAVDLIIEQGEGEDKGIFGDEGELSHFYRFDQLIRKRYYQSGKERSGQPPDRPGQPTGPDLKVDWSAVYPIQMDAKLEQYPPGSELHTAAIAFSAAYAEFLAMLQQAFTGRPDLLLKAVPKMFELRNRMIQIMRVPLEDGSGFNAAPIFKA